MNATQRLKQLNGSLDAVETDDYALLSAVLFVPDANGFNLQATLDANMAFATYGKRDEYAGVKVLTLRQLVQRNEGAMRNPVTGGRSCCRGRSGSACRASRVSAWQWRMSGS